MYDVGITPNHPLRYLHPVTFRVHELARQHDQRGQTLVWILRTIGIQAKSPSSKVTLEEIESEAVAVVLAAHQHRPFPKEEPSMVISEDYIPPAKCRCGVRIRMKDGDWRLTPQP